MAFIPCLQVVMVEIRLEYCDQNVENTLYFKRDAGVGQTHVTQCADGIAEWWYDRLRHQQHTWVTMREVYARDMTYEESYHATNVTYWGIAGGRSTGVGTPANVTKSVSFRTGKVGRTMRGRNYTIGISTADITGNQIHLTYGDAIIDIYEDLLTPGTYYPSGMYWVVCSRYFNGEPRQAALSTMITAVVMTNLNVDSCRSRLTGRGT